MRNKESGVKTGYFQLGLSLEHIPVEMAGNEAEMKPSFYVSHVAIYVS